ncbi:hypothetical protein HSX11_25910 [Oxalobacteraceae bacterium]|nr:hypothetical protein [Oxalobacteraceae bacterium]
MISIAFPPSEADVIYFACSWTDKLVSQNYAAAHEMLHHVAEQPGRSWVSAPDELKEWISNYGSDTPVEGDPSYVVTEISTASGSRWDNDLDLAPVQERYAGFVGRLDWWLPLNGEWSDLQASFDLIDLNGKVAFVLVALRVP